MNNLIVIGIAGHNRSGKSTAADALSLCGFLKIGLADSIRSSLNDLDGPTWELRKKIDGYTGAIARRAMQVLGTECREDVDSEDLWIKLALAKIRYMNNYCAISHSRFVIPDIRYQNEIDVIGEWIRAWGGIYETWRVSRSGFSATSEHSSETSIDSLGPIAVTFNNVNGQKHYMIDLIMSNSKTMGWL